MYINLRSPTGVKADKAPAWSLPAVNHTWPEGCFIQWPLLTPAAEKYITLSPCLDFRKLLRKRGVGVRGVGLCEEEEVREVDDGDNTSEGLVCLIPTAQRCTMFLPLLLIMS
jgi:hypothetical protein